MRASHAAIARVFGALIPLQPVAWSDDGLICAPRVALDDITDAITSCPLPTESMRRVTVWPDSPAALVAGWYRRSDRHAPAPFGVPELVQVAGDGFGSGDHATTAMCLAAFNHLPSGPAVDAGCGSGLLAQAWALRWSVHVLAVDLDPGAVAQTRASVAAAGCANLVEVRRQTVQMITADELSGRVVFANLLYSAQTKLLVRFDDPPAAIVVSGLRPTDATHVVSAYQRMGLRHIRAMRHGGFDCHVLVGRT